MGRYRKVDTRIWNDAKFRGLSHPAKLVWLFILTHPHLTPLGAMRATLAGLAEELGMTPKGFREAFKEPFLKGMLYYCPKSSCLVIPKFLKYNPPENPNVVKSWEKVLDLIPESGLKAFLFRYVKGFVEGLGKGFQEALPEPLSKGMPIPEPEPEPYLKEELECFLAKTLSSEQALTDGEDGEKKPGKPIPPLKKPEKVKKEKRTTARQIVDLWNEIAPIPGMEPVELIEERKRKIDSRLTFRDDLEYWRKIFMKVKGNPFLRGEKGWKATLDWIMNNNLNGKKIYEGQYDDRGNQNTGANRQGSGRDGAVCDGGEGEGKFSRRTDRDTIEVGD